MVSVLVRGRSMICRRSMLLTIMIATCIFFPTALEVSSWTRLVAEPMSKICQNSSLFLRMPRPEKYFDEAQGAKSFLKDLLERQANVQWCMMSGLLPLRAVVHECLPEMSCGGLGDRLQGITFALIVASVTDRALFIDHRRPDKLEKYLQPSGKVDWLLSSLPQKTAERVMNHAFDKWNIDHASGGCRELVEDWKHLANTTTVRWKTNLPPVRACVTDLFTTLIKEHGKKAALLLRKLEEHELFAMPMHHLFKPTSIVERATARFVKRTWGQFRENSARIWPECTVCFHIRTGGRMGTNVNIDKEVHQYMNLNFEDFGQCGRMVEQTHWVHRCPGRRMWLVVSDSSDEAPMLKRLSSFSNGSRVISTRSMGRVLHIDRFVAEQMRNDSLFGESLLRVFVDFNLLRQCRYLVKSESFFSLAATFFHSGPEGALHWTVPGGGRCAPTKLNIKDMLPGKFRHFFP